MFLSMRTLVSLLCFVPGLLVLGCNVSCPENSQRDRCLNGRDPFLCSSPFRSKPSCDAQGYCRCHKSVLYDGCTCLPHVSGCFIKESPIGNVGLPTTDGEPETPFYGCISTSINCEYEVHVIGNYESSNGRHGFGIPSVPGDTYVNVIINGQSSKKLIFVFSSYEPVNWRLSLPSGVIVDRILINDYYHKSKVIGNFNTEVAPLESGYGPNAASNIVYLTNRFGPIASLSGSYRADRWNVNINRSPACNSLSTRPKQPIVIRFKKENYTVNENEESITVVMLTNGPTDRNIIVQYSTIDETAEAPMDYTAVNRRSIIPANTTQFELTILIQFDKVHEPNETFRVHVSLPDQPTLCVPDATVLIINSNGDLTVAIVGGVLVIGVFVLISIVVAVVACLYVRFKKKQSTSAQAAHNGTVTRTIHDETNGNITTNNSQIYPLPLPTTVFTLPAQPEPSESVAPTITKLQICDSITQAPPPAYDIHETFATYNGNKKLSEAPPEYNIPPPTYNTATQKNDN